MSLSTCTERAEPTGVLRAARGPALAGAGVAAGCAALLLRDPHAGGSWGYCPFLLLTGQPCPACGGLRATNDLLRGDLAAALGSNAYVVLTVVVAVVLWAIWLGRMAAGRPPTCGALRERLPMWWLVGLLAFGVLRFVPGFTDLQP